MKLLKFVIATFLAGAIASCGSSKSGKHDSDKKNGERNGNGNRKGDGNSLALALTDAQTLALSNWKSALFKSCNVEAIFTDKNRGEPAIDIAKLPEKLGGQFYIETDGLILLLGEPIEFFDYHSVNEQTLESSPESKQTLKTEQTGNDCVIYVNGEKIHQAQLIAGVSVLGAFKRDDNRYTESTYILPTLKHFSSDIGQVQNFEMNHILSNLFQLDEEKEKRFAESLGLSLPHFRSVFSRTGTWSDTYHAMTFANHPGIHPFGMNQNHLRGNANELKSLVPATREEPIDIVMDWTSNSQWEKLGIAFANKLKISISATWHSLDGKKQTYDLTIKEMKSIQADDERAVNCFLNRHKDLSKLRSLVNTSKFWPGYDASYCQAFATDWPKLVDENPGINDLINELFRDLTTPYPNHFYLWDSVLTNLIEKHFDANNWQQWSHFQNLPIVQNALANIQELEKRLATSTTELQSILENTQSLGSAWAFKDLSVDTRRLDTLFSALNNTAAIFSQATSRLWWNLRVNPYGYDAELDFAQGINDEYKHTFQNMKTPADATLMSDWYQSLLADVLEKRYPLPTVKSWLTTLNDGRSFVEENRVADDSIPFFDSKVKDFMSHVLKETWTKREFDIVSKIVPLAKYKFSCSLANSNAIALAKCVGFDDLSNKNSKVLAQGFGNRYVDLASFIQAWAPKLDSFDFERTRRALVDKFFKPVWKNATDNEFNQAKSSLDSLLNKLTTAEWSERFRVQSEIDGLLDKG